MGDITSAALLLGSLVFSFVNFLRWLTSADWKPVINQLVAWAAGLAAVFLVAGTQWAAGINLMTVTLDQANIFEKVILGLVVASVYSPIAQVIKAVDSSQTAQVPAVTEPPPPKA